MTHHATLLAQALTDRCQSRQPLTGMNPARIHPLSGQSPPLSRPITPNPLKSQPAHREASKAYINRLPPPQRDCLTLHRLLDGSYRHPSTTHTIRYVHMYVNQKVIEKCMKIPGRVPPSGKAH